MAFLTNIINNSTHDALSPYLASIFNLTGTSGSPPKKKNVTSNNSDYPEIGQRYDTAPFHFS